MEAWPRITVVTPSYNQACFLQETIESVTSQGYPNLEYFVVDGGSQDESPNVIRNLQERIDWWVCEPDRGQTDAINKGFRLATGELLAWVNSDDILLPGCLNAVAETYKRERKPDIIHGNCVYLDGDSRITRAIRTPRQTLFWMEKGIWYASAPAVFFKAESLSKVGYLDSRYRLSMDVDVWLKLMLAGARVAFVSRYLGAFRWHDVSKTSVSIRHRGSHWRENPETEQLFDAALRASSQATRWRWRACWKVMQVINLNYLKAWIDTCRLHGLHWRRAFNTFSR